MNIPVHVFKEAANSRKSDLRRAALSYLNKYVDVGTHKLVSPEASKNVIRHSDDYLQHIAKMYVATLRDNILAPVAGGRSIVGRAAKAGHAWHMSEPLKTARASADKRAFYIAFMADAHNPQFTSTDWTAGPFQFWLDQKVALVELQCETTERLGDWTSFFDQDIALSVAEPDWFIEMRTSFNKDFVEMISEAAAAIGHSALNDARDLALREKLPRPGTWNMSEEGLLSLEWENDSSALLIVFSGDFEASFSIKRAVRFFDNASSFDTRHGLSADAKKVVTEMLGR